MQSAREDDEVNGNMDSLRATLADVRRDLLAREHVVAAGIGYKVVGGARTGKLSIVCSVVRKVPEALLAARDLVPVEIRGIPTDVVETGILRAQLARTDRWRPAPGGVSIGHPSITAGTLGCLVRKNQQLCILSNNHVLAAENVAAIGDPIIQPGTYDGGRDPADRIAVLQEFVPIQFLTSDPSDCPLARGIAALANLFARAVGSTTRPQAVRFLEAENMVDAALAGPVNLEDVSPEILDLGVVQSIGSAGLGTPVRKSGRTTAVTTGEIQQVDVTADVSYGAGRTARFTGQLMAGAMSQGGDSGSAVLDGGGNLVGLLFAGSDTTTLINPVEHVVAALGIGL
ncbi:MAG: S1 family peptidase [Methanomicrobiales archaeon]|nr:S1 family peptidase [Methanomicrobiales archaeon]